MNNAAESYTVSIKTIEQTMSKAEIVMIRFTETSDDPDEGKVYIRGYD